MARKILLSFSILITLFLSAQEKRYKPDVIAFYNLENLFDTIDDPQKNDEDFLPTGVNRNNTYVYTDKLGKLCSVLSEIGTDVNPDGFAFLGVAEVENRKVLEDLIAQPKLRDRKLRIVHYESPDERGIDVGLLYNPKYFKVKSSRSLFVHLPDNNGKPYYTRDVLWVTGELDGETVHIFVNHWPSRRGGEEASAPSRAAAAGVCKHVIDSLMALDSKTKVVVMGDLNDDPNSPSVTEVIGAANKADKVQPGGMYNPWMDFLEKGIGTLAYNDSWNLFDQIMLSYGFLDDKQSGFFYKQARIFSKQYMVTKTGKYKGYPMRTYSDGRYIGGYSDHFPTYCILLKALNKK
jgi:hypothetical protein